MGNSQHLNDQCGTELPRAHQEIKKRKRREHQKNQATQQLFQRLQSIKVFSNYPTNITQSQRIESKNNKRKPKKNKDIPTHAIRRNRDQIIEEEEEMHDDYEEHGNYHRYHHNHNANDSDKYTHMRKTSTIQPQTAPNYSNSLPTMKASDTTTIKKKRINISYNCTQKIRSQKKSK